MPNDQTDPHPPLPVQLPLTRRTLEEAISEVDREIKVRVRCYDRWIEDGKLSRVDARDRIERMQAALAYLEEKVKSTD